MKVTHMRTENGFINYRHFEVMDDKGTRFFQSFHTLIVKIFQGQVFLDKRFWKFSPTTSKYRNMFLSETTEETQAKIDSNDYVLIDLNPEKAGI